MTLFDNGMIHSNTGNLDEPVRPRKYSETWREVEDVDQPVQVPPSQREQPQPRCASPGYGDGSEKGITDDMMASFNQPIDHSMPTASSPLSAKSDSTTTKNSSTRAQIENVTDEYLASLPTVSASPIVTMGESTVAAVVATATEVQRLPSTDREDRRARLICVKVFKETLSTKLGIRLQLSNEGHLQITRLQGYLEESPLRPGDELVLLNGQNVSAWTTAKALSFLRDAWGWMSITVRNPNYTSDSSLCMTSLCKNSMSDKLGISFERNEEEVDAPLRVRGLNVAGLLGGRTTVRVGDIVESINSISSCHMDNSTAVNMIRSVPDWVHIVVRKEYSTTVDFGMVQVLGVQEKTNTDTMDVSTAKDLSHEQPHEESEDDALESTEVIDETVLDVENATKEPALISLTLYKTHQAEKIGLSLIKVNDALYIKKVAGPLEGGVIREGMMLLSINQHLTAHMSLSEACSFLKNRVGLVTLLAKNPHGNPKYIQAVAHKKTSEGQNLVGVSFKGAEGSQLRICELRQDGLFVKSCLNIGDSVLQINETPCRHWRPKDAVDLVRSSSSTVSILAKTKSKYGVVVARISKKRR